VPVLRVTNQFNTTKRSPVWPDRVRKLDLGLLGVSKKVTAEAAERFYGRNTFSFNALFERHLKWIEQWQVIFPSRIDWRAVTCQGHGIAKLEIAVVDAGSRRSVKMPATYKPLVSLEAPSDLCLQCPPDKLTAVTTYRLPLVDFYLPKRGVHTRGPASHP
jgi:hypothetical protein